MATNQLSLGFRFDSGGHAGGDALPRSAGHIHVPPLKCQGIKTKLAPFILASVRWDGKGRWIEPFVGSGVVLLNVAPQRAYAVDTNVHIIHFYRDVASGALTPAIVREHLETEGQRLATRGSDYYYEVRNRFNSHPSSLDFLFLNRACFNGVMRFNRSGLFNVPFGQKPLRFSRAYVTKIVNQVAYACRVLQGRDWTFEVADWRSALELAHPDDFIYADPPYFGRHTDYYNCWTEAEADHLLLRLRNAPCGFALSTWKQNKYRHNPQLDVDMTGVEIRTTTHFYHVGPTEDLRHEMEEALVIRRGWAAD